MRLLIVGSGGREHALGWAIIQNAKDVKLFFAPGNGGTSLIGKNLELEWRDVEVCKREVLKLAIKNSIDFVIIGPEVPLVGGVVDYLTKEKIPVFGPIKEAARLEGSKCWAKDWMRKHLIPTPNFYITSNVEEAIYILKKKFQDKGRIVIKADGLAYGKGSFIISDYKEGEKIIFDLLINRILGAAGERLVIEEYIEGEELTLMMLTDTSSYILLPPCRDYKRLKDNDKGPNTGGMGSYAPALKEDDERLAQIEKEIVIPTLKALREDSIPFFGVLYFGLIIEKDSCKVYVLEYNVRFGDPETQALVPLISEYPLLSYLLATFQNNLEKLPKIKGINKSSVCVVLASEGYPEKPKIGRRIYGLQEGLIFHAGTQRINDAFYTSSGRVLNVVGLGDTLQEARDNAYSLVDKIKFENMQFRRDIGLI